MKRGSDVPVVQVFGERNSATNYVIELIENNFAVFVERGVDPARFSLASQRLPWAARELASDLWFVATRTTFKHGLLTEPVVSRLERQGITVVDVVKHPLSWALSTYRRPYHRGEVHHDLVEFVSTPWKTVGRENMGRRAVANAFELWAAKAEAALDLAELGRIELWRFEDVLVDERGHLTRLAERMDLPLPDDLARVPSNIKTQHGITETHDQIAEHYGSEAWRAEVPEAMVEVARASCGEIATRLGYAL